MLNLDFLRLWAMFLSRLGLVAVLGVTGVLESLF